MVTLKHAGIVLTLIAGTALAWWQIAARRGEAAPAYRFVEIERGDLESVVTSTGTLETVTTVEVGTQVSGQIAEILVDFNGRVRRGQLIARIDPTLLQQEVRSAEAALERRDAEERQRRWELERARTLHADGVVNDSDFETAGYAHTVAVADLKAARVSLERARRNLEYTEIRAPIDGVVVERNVDVGQTVAASLQAPTLFRIAGDLSHMRILASVDESDIGRVREGQGVRFTVQSYPGTWFKGAVEQVRLQSATLENVVNYTVVVAVDNADGRLLPGMTATAEFLVDSASGVLKVANAALRLRASERMRAELGPDHPALSAAGGSGEALLWFIGDSGRLDALRVRTGIGNGQQTQIEGEGVREGMRVIAGISSGADTPASSPFDSRRPGRPPHPPGI
jgi:HlyD family secretion protein